MATKTEPTGGTLVKDPELKAMQQIAKAYIALEELEPSARGRVKQWACAKFHPVVVSSPKSTVGINSED